MKKPSKNILIAHSSNDMYGASKVLISTIEILISNGFVVHLILPCNGPLNNNKIIKKVNLSIVKLGVFRKKYFNILGLFNRLYFILKSIIIIKNYIRKNKIELVYTNTSTLISPCISAFISKIPSVYHIHEIPTGSNLYLKFLVKLINKFSNKAIAVSNIVKEYWIRNGLIEDKINVIYNGYDFEFVLKKQNNNKMKIFTNISRIIPYKGHDFLIDLFIEISKKRNDFLLQIVGDTLPSYEKYYSHLIKKVKQNRLENNIVFMGFRNDVKNILIESDFLIHSPIKPDPAPAVILEAIETRTPVIYTNNDGAHEILDNGKNGLQIHSISIKRSCDIILDYISKSNIQNRKIEDSIQYISKKFNKELYKNKLVNLLSEF